MKAGSIYPITLSAVISLICCTLAESQPNPASDTQFEIAFTPDVHFHDLFADFNEDFNGLPTLYKGENRFATIRTIQAQLTSTRHFNENYFALIAALDDAVNRGIKFIALPGDFSDDGQPIHVKGLVDILDLYQEQYDIQFFCNSG